MERAHLEMIKTSQQRVYGKGDAGLGSALHSHGFGMSADDIKVVLYRNTQSVTGSSAGLDRCVLASGITFELLFFSRD